MGKEYITREGEATAIDTYGELTTVGSETAPGVPKVPAKADKLLGVIVAAETTHAAAGVASGNIKLSGGGLPRGEETIAIGTIATRVATGRNSYMPPKFIRLGKDGVQVTGLQDIHIEAQFVNEDVGAMSFGVSLVFKVPN